MDDQISDLGNPAELPAADELAAPSAKEVAALPVTDSLRILEAVVFASTEILPLPKLKAILPDQPDARVIRTMVAKVNEKLQKERHPFEIVEVGGGFQFRTVPYYHPWVQQLFKEKAQKRLSIQALESLAIIAYKQPITKAEIESIRGVISDGAMKTLLEKRLITIVGRSEKVGHPLLYGTSQSFLTYFGLNKIVDLPRIEEFEEMARKKMEELSEEELKNIETMASAEPEAAEVAAEAANELSPEPQAEPENTSPEN